MLIRCWDTAVEAAITVAVLEGLWMLWYGYRIAVKTSAILINCGRVMVSYGRTTQADEGYGEAVNGVELKLDLFLCSVWEVEVLVGGNTLGSMH